MSVSRYKLNAIGWIGTAMFILPTPIGSWEYYGALNRFAKRSNFDRRVDELAGQIALPDFSPFLFTTLATASLIGLVLLLVGRDIETIR